MAIGLSLCCTVKANCNLLHVISPLFIVTLFTFRYEVNNNFKTNLKIVLCGGGKPQPDTSKYGEDKHGRDIPFLEKYAKERWESLLYYMTGSTSEGGISNY